MTLAQLLTLLYDRKLPQGYRSIDLTVKLGSKVISDPSLSKTDSFKRLHTEKGERSCFFGIFLFKILLFWTKNGFYFLGKKQQFSIFSWVMFPSHSLQVLKFVVKNKFIACL